MEWRDTVTPAKCVHDFIPCLGDRERSSSLLHSCLVVCKLNKIYFLMFVVILRGREYCLLAEQWRTRKKRS